MKINIKTIYIEILNKCNAYCKYCYNDSIIKNEKYLTINQIDNLLDTFSAYGLEKVEISGGEPLLHKELYEIIKMIYYRRYKICICTNGSLLIEQTIDFFNKYNVFMQISLNGSTSETHDSILKLKGAYENIIKVFTYSNRINYSKFITIRTIVSKKNINQLEDIINLCKNYKITKFNFSLLMYSGRDNSINNILCESHYFFKSIDNIKNKYCDLSIDRNSCITKCKFFENLEEIYIAPRINPQGKIYLCTLFDDDNYIGDINNNLTEEKISDSIKELRNILKLEYENNEDCKNCFFKRKCKGGCPGLSFKQSGHYIHDGLCSERILENVIKTKKF